MTIPTGRKIRRTLFHAQRPENWIWRTRAENREWPRQTTHEPRNQARTRNQPARSGAFWGLRSQALGGPSPLPAPRASPPLWGPPPALDLSPHPGGLPRPWTSPPTLRGLPPALGLSPARGQFPRLWGLLLSALRAASPLSSIPPQRIPPRAHRMTLSFATSSLTSYLSGVSTRRLARREWFPRKVSGVPQ